MRTNSKMTLYSRGISNRGESWSRSLVSAVHWENRKAANVISSGLLAADSVAVWIPGLSVSVKVGDVIVKGDISTVVNSSTYTMSDLKKDNPSAVTVTSVDVYDYGSPRMQHIRLGAS